MTRRFRTTTLGVLGLAAGAALQAQTAPEGLNYRLGLGVEYSDNMARRPVAVSETAISPTLGFAWLSMGGRGQFEAAGDLAYRHYRDGRFDDELTQRVGANGRWVFLPERLSWEFQGTLADQPLDPFSVDAPDNRQRTTVFVTGPNLALRPAATLRLQGELRYMLTEAERTPEFDGDRVGGAFRAIKEIDPLASVSGEIELFDVNYDLDAIASDYQRFNAFARYSRRGAKGDWTADLGYSRVSFDRVPAGFDRREDLPFARVRLSRQLGDLSRLEFDVQRSYGDTAQDLLDNAPRAVDYALPVGIVPLRGGFVSADLFKQTGGRISLSRRDQTVYLRADGQWRRQDYLRVSGLDQTIRGLSISASRQVRGTFSIGAQAGADWRDFRSTNREDRDSRIAAFATWQVSRRAGLNLELSRTERDSTVATQNFTDNRVLVSVQLVR